MSHRAKLSIILSDVDKAKNIHRSNNNVFDPRPSPFIQRLVVHRNSHLPVSESSSDIIQSDNDIWIEQSYKTIKGRTVRYYCSIMTGEIHLKQPPTGAGMVVYQHQLEEEKYQILQVYVKSLPPVTNNMIKSMNKPRRDIALSKSLGLRQRSR